MKHRKPRGIKLNGQRSLDMCTCYSFHCDPMTVSRAFSAKIDRRRAMGVHPPCGTNPCTCKSKMSIHKKVKIPPVGAPITAEVERAVRLDTQRTYQWWADHLGVPKKTIWDIKHKPIERGIPK